MKKATIYILFFILPASCEQKTNNIDYEVEILNDIFLDLVGTEYYYEELPIPPLPLEYAQNKQDSVNYYLRKDSVDEAFNNRKLDRNQLVIVVEPYYINPKRQFEGWATSESDFPREFYPDSLHSKDFDQLYRQIVDSTTFRRGELDLSKLLKTGKYIIKDLEQLEINNEEYWKSTEYRYIATLRFSDFKINTNNDHATFYLSFFCGGLCGSGEIVFCKKVNEKWEIVWKNILWVS